ncbi:MAG: M23 family metallopeptidase [Chloroflexota bacterium]
MTTLATQVTVGQLVYAAGYLNVRKTPGYVSKPGTDVIAQIVLGTEMTLLSGPTEVDGLTWWSIQGVAESGTLIKGWVADTDPTGMVLLSASQLSAQGNGLPQSTNGTFSIGQEVANVTADPVNLRATAGYVNKPDSDVICGFPAQARLTVQQGPQTADGLSWWCIGGTLPTGESVRGWVAESAPDGIQLLGHADTGIKDNTLQKNNDGTIAVGKPFQGNFAMSQAWGSNAEFYRQFLYDGVPLKGHNGLDFATPVGTPLTAIDDGVAIKVGFEAGGFGNYILLKHAWGESLSAHLDQVYIGVGTQVARGQVMGATGNTGCGSGPHLHFGIRVTPYTRQDGWGGCSDPQPYMNPADIFRSRSASFAPAPMAQEKAGMARP